MKRILAVLVAYLLVVGAAAPASAHWRHYGYYGHRGGGGLGLALGILGGLAILGGAAPQLYYYAPPPVYNGPRCFNYWGWVPTPWGQPQWQLVARRCY